MRAIYLQCGLVLAAFSGVSQDPREDRWQWDIDKTRQYLDEQAIFMSQGMLS